MSTAIRFDNVSKRFTLHHQRPRSFQELVIQLFKGNSQAPEQRCEITHAPGGQEHEEFWALRDVSFTVEHGETFGIIGPNGAGKSTVLKLISRIVEPTSGEIEVSGRIGALLELGAGFHPDLSGRENIYLNGSILGLDRAEIDTKLDDIIGFAELERFIDMPVKHYSSGMRMRLGFSIAVHTDRELLLIDEVLAVGDQAFQSKCFRRIGEMQDRGVTVLFVSHSPDTVRRLCDRAVWLEAGEVRGLGPADQTVIEYLSRAWEGTSIRLLDEGEAGGRGRRWGSEEVVITGLEFLAGHGRRRHVFQTGETFVARIHYLARRPVRKPSFGVAIYRKDGTHVTGPNTVQSGYDIEVVEGEGVVDYIIESLPLLPGRYEFTAAIYDYHSVHPYDHQHRAYVFEVQSGPVSEMEGLVRIPCRWEHRCDPAGIGH